MKPFEMMLFYVLILPSTRPLQAQTEVPTINLPVAQRVHNYSPMGQGSCVWASIQTCQHWQNVECLRTLTREVSGGSWANRVRRELDKRGASYVCHESGDYRFLDRAIASRRPAAVTVQKGYHMVTLVHLDGKVAGLIDNNHPEKIEWFTRADFLMQWRAADGWAVVLMHAPTPPLPFERNR